MKPIVLDPRNRPWMFIGMMAVLMVVVFLMLMLWIGLTLWLNQDPTRPVSADVIFNYMLVSLLSFCGLPLFHRAILRHAWRRETRRLAGLPLDPDDVPGRGLPAADPLPKTRKSWQQWALYIVFYLYGLGFLMVAFGPLSNQVWLMRFIARHSAGSASAGSLMNIIFVVPTGIALLALLFVLDRERKAIERGSFDPVETLRLRLKHEWLASFLIALSTCAILCFLVGRLTARYLS
jgi:hypothetical protein